MDIIIDQIIRASRFEGEDDGVYFLGPFSRRVSFAAQQNRALNLVYALRERNRLRDPVAVVGGGLAGLVITSALVALGHHVELFESNPQILARQRNASHRFIHPTVNAWPEHHSLDPTTQLPFFDWCADVCKDVMSAFDIEWTPVRQLLSQQKRLHLETEVKGYRVQSSGISLEIGHGRENKLFNTVIFATGFEDENSIDNAREGSYWREDNLESIRDSNIEAHFVISGIGDGGLIDSLRLVHSRFDGGKLAVRAATALFDTEIARRIRDAEAEFGADHSPAAEQKLKAVYEDCARNLPSDLVVELELSRIKVLPLVWLVGRDSATPFGRDAAPIHKLLVAHAINEGSIHFVPNGKVNIAPDGKVTIEPKNETPRVPLHSAVIRHGADNKLKKLLENKQDQLEKLIAAQRNLSDDLVNPFWMKGELPLVLGYPAHDPATREFQNSRFRRAKAIERIWPHMWLSRDRDGFIIESETPEGWRPKALFGIPVKFGVRYGDTWERP
jgi:hypothetical protein